MPVSHKKNPNPPKRQIGVVDIGSNSVRLVIYRLDGSTPVIIKDKKVTCRLAQGMHHAHPALNARGMEKTLKVLASFKAMLIKHKVTEVLPIATAAFRAVQETKAGQAFHKKAEKALGHIIEIISGQTEAQLTAHGVMAVLPKAAGLCGDLGGGSLELASIKQGKVLHTSTVALGTLTLLSETHGDAIFTEHLVAQRLRHVAWLRHGKGKVFYAIGGSWRAVGRIMMIKRGVKKRSIHGFSIAAAAAKKYAGEIALQKPAELRTMPKKIKQRADIIPMAAATLAQLIVTMQPSKIVFSGHGVREGLVRKKLGR
jgi:exopolyphosphatase/guanosine-5'-triphosphate,3'-diphosphate pyrophosphatase